MSHPRHSDHLRGVVVLIAAVAVIIVSASLMWSMLQEQKGASRPEVPTRYLKSNGAEVSPPAPFIDVKLDENQLIP